jgi:hypothetical protein
MGIIRNGISYRGITGSLLFVQSSLRPVPGQAISDYILILNGIHIGNEGRVPGPVPLIWQNSMNAIV